MPLTVNGYKGCVYLTTGLSKKADHLLLVITAREHTRTRLCSCGWQATVAKWSAIDAEECSDVYLLQSSWISWLYPRFGTPTATSTTVTSSGRFNLNSVVNSERRTKWVGTYAMFLRRAFQPSHSRSENIRSFGQERRKVWTQQNFRQTIELRFYLSG
jgi:hypothetical protein